jgi:hypothetical protein
MSRVAFVTTSPPQVGWEDDRLPAEALESEGVEVEFVAWDDGSIEWDSFDRVVIRSAWDYFDRPDEFIAWANAIGQDLLRNRPEVIEWNSDKRYLAEMSGSGLPVPPTMLLGPGSVPEFEDEVVVKPVVGGGGRRVGRFGPDAREALLDLLGEIWEDGGTAMVQPYLDEVEESGETAVCLFGGEVSHTLRKGAFLPADERVPVTEEGVAEAMYDPDLVIAARAGKAEMLLAERTIAWLTARFGSVPLYARIDMIPDGPLGPVLIEVELIEPHFYFEVDREAGGHAYRQFADAVVAELG